ncbi:MAG TPA: tetratricopeptide repeat protein [Aliidongia sp.]|uniref:tetratricopeptide repeat protein n=1 Tax=Aliidongia sp. TaxID=1914230 RepID=UPI002DDC9FE6|nr:tetratricopeptide repeat protein [Aliidongia sp.]HEV2678180.1 tetratricopeptide repeat protein [Aliidongia sp.]
MADRETRLEAAISRHGLGHYVEAEAIYRELLAERADDADALHLLGVLTHQRGRSDDGRALIEAALAIDDTNPIYHNNLASVRLALGDRAGAETSAQRALALRADYPDALVNLGTALVRSGRLDEAGGHYRAALRLRADDAESWFHFGNLLALQGRTDQSIEVYRQALSLRPGHGETLVNLGNALKLNGDRENAAACYRQALQIDPSSAPALNNLGNLLQAAGRLTEAEELYRRLLALDPDHAGALGNLGSVLQAQARFDEAMACYGRALEIAPDDAAARHNLATAFKRQNRLGDAIAEYRRALAIVPDYPEALSGLGAALQAQGRVDEAVPFYERALTRRPDFHEPLNHLMFALNALPDSTGVDLLAAARRWTAAWSLVPAPATDRANSPDPDRPLRVGYVSPDFRHHPVGYFLTAILGHHDPAAVEIHCYCNSRIADDVTRRIAGAVKGWRDITALDDASAAALIRADGIDILVDLSGHMADHRLPLFQHRPAPVQVTWLGFFCSTGLDAIDHIIADPTIIPVEAEAWYVERVWRLPHCYLCFDGGTVDVPVGPLPAGAAGPITFGCFNRRDKMSAPALAAWAEILRRVPGARLLLKTASFSDPVTRSEMMAAFARLGIGAERLIIEGATPRQAHLEAYRRIDLALDPFPYTGATTSAEALWMGVPLVTLRGHTFVGRVSASMLQAVGRSELIADTVEDYIDRAVALAADRTRLAGLRDGLRAATRAGLGDGAGFARSLEAIYRAQWHEWCRPRR